MSRRIDADALIEDLKHDVALDQDSLDYEELTDSNREIIQFDKDCKQNAIDLLQNAPTIEPQRKTGKWIQFPNHMAYKCSECGRVIQTTDGQRNVSKHYPFCHCGADMRCEDDDIPIEYFESGGI